jgi:hypothetical protein
MKRRTRVPILHLTSCGHFQVTSPQVRRPPIVGSGEYSMIIDLHGDVSVGPCVFTWLDFSLTLQISPSSPLRAKFFISPLPYLLYLRIPATSFRNEVSASSDCCSMQHTRCRAAACRYGFNAVDYLSIH